MKPIESELAALLPRALKQAGIDARIADPTFETPREEKFGDLSTNFVFRIAKERKTAPKPLAEKVAAAMNDLVAKSSLKERLSKIAVEGAGYLNFYFSPQEIARVVFQIHAEGENFGKPRTPQKRNILLEFVSANPTGPLTVAHGRQAALGDSLAHILRFCGHKVTTEYYNNDEGVQINILGESMAARAKQVVENVEAIHESPLPENYYQGEYLIDIAKEFVHKFNPRKPYPKDLADKCRVYARDRIMEGIVKDLADFNVAFDHYYSQEALGKSGRVESTLELLKKKGVVYENEGALWFKSTTFGDDKDRVLIKSDKTYTYLTPDIAYHHEKFERGFDELINIWGPDHHGYIARLKASQEALGRDPKKIHILIAQLVTLYEEGKQVRMSTRAGEFVTLREIIDEVGRDAGRFFFLMRKFDAHLDFDLSLAKSQTPDNPVFYIQYAHARIESIKKTYEENVGLISKIDWKENGAPVPNPLEITLLRQLRQFESIVLAAEKTLEPYRLVSYLMILASAFHRFYVENRVVGEDRQLTRARMRLVLSTQSVIRKGLELLGVSAPLKM